MQRLLLMCLLAASGAAEAQMGFKDLVLGQPITTERLQILGCNPQDNKCFYNSRSRHPGAPPIDTIAGTAVKGIGIVRKNGALEALLVTFDSNSFEHVLAAFTEKHPGLKCVSSEVKGMTGGKFDQLKCLYTAPDGQTLSLTKRSGTVDEGNIYLTTAAFDAESAKTQAASKKDI